ncbi:hypothetical protein KKH56_06785 [bacterium]|nr:hypothetical protein [bacterium]
MRIMTHLSQILKEERFAKEERTREGIGFLQRLRNGEVFILQPEREVSSLSEERLDGDDLSRVMDLSSKIKAYAADLASELYLAKALKEHKNSKFLTS